MDPDSTCRARKEQRYSSSLTAVLKNIFNLTDLIDNWCCSTITHTPILTKTNLFCDFYFIHVSAK